VTKPFCAKSILGWKWMVTEQGPNLTKSDTPTSIYNDITTHFVSLRYPSLLQCSFFF